METRRCKGCDVLKSVKEYYSRRRLCKSCYIKKCRARTVKILKKDKLFYRKVQMRFHYGLTLDDYDLLSESQNHLCKICRQKQKTKTTKHLFVDHCHTTKEVRGLLCHGCNVMIGHAEKDKPPIKTLRQAIKYLKEKSWKKKKTSKS